MPAALQNIETFSRSRSPKNRRARARKAARVFFLRHPLGFALFTGVVVELTSIGVGLLLIRAHGNGWPWWFHGVVISLITGLMAATITWLYAREMRLHDGQVQAAEQMSHEVCNALQILVQRRYMYPERRTQLEDEAIERIRKATREVLPDLFQIPVESRPQSPVADGADGRNCKRTAV